MKPVHISLAIAVFAIVVLLMLVSPAQALTIELQENGKVLVYPNKVLGETDDRVDENKGQEMQKPAEAVRVESSKPQTLDKEMMKKFEEQKQETNKRMQKEKEQASRVKRVLENPRSSIELEMQKEGASAVSVKMREFEKSKREVEDIKRLEEAKREQEKDALEMDREQKKKAMEFVNNEKKEQLDQNDELKDELENEQKGEDKKKEVVRRIKQKSEGEREMKSIVEEKVEDMRVMMGQTQVRSTNKGFEIERGDVKVKTNLPVSIEKDAQQISIVTPTGQKIVTTLPDEAKNTVVSSGLANEVIGEIELKQKGDDVVFHMNTTDAKRMFGFLPVSVNREVEVSATTGQITGTTQSFGQRLLDFFSL